MGCLIKGVNDLLTRNPELAKQWHPTKNKITPDMVGEMSNKKVWWLLPYDDPQTGKHFDFEWEATPNARSNGRGCPFISHKALWSGFNDLATVNPQLASEWHPTKNGDLKPDMVTGKSSKMVWWFFPYDDPITGKHYDFEWQASVNNRSKGSKCPYVTGRCAWKGYNDLWTTNPDIAQYLKTPEEGYSVMMNSDKKLDFVCPDCGNIVHKRPCKILNDKGSFICPQCGDGFPYTEKFVFNMLSQLKEYFVFQLSSTTFKWCESYRYDFYLPDRNMIIEVHGGQHYISTTWGSVEDIQKNDSDKRKLALNNGISDYICIDASCSNIDYLTDSIIKSLGGVFNLSSIDWAMCGRFASSSLKTSICYEWDNAKSLITDFAEKYKISCDIILIYLEEGNKLGLCEFDRYQYRERIKMDGKTKRFTKKVICLDDKRTFHSIQQASDFYGIKFNTVWHACRISKTHRGNNYHFMYLDDYEKLADPDLYFDQLINIEKNIYSYGKAVVNLDNWVVYDSISKAAEALNIPLMKLSQGLNNQCNSIKDRCGNNHHLMFYYEYIRDKNRLGD